MKEFFAVLTVVVALFLMGFGMGHDYCKHYVRKEAIQAGAAKYVVDEKTGQVEFIWLGEKNDK